MEARIPYVACPLCDSGRIPKLREADCTRHPLYRSVLPATMTWKVCEDCGHVFTSGYWSAAALTLLFSSANEGQRPGADMERQRYVSARIVDRVISAFGQTRCANWRPLGAAWLDVGFGNGSLLFTAEEYGFSIAGLDLRPDTVDAMRGAGFEAHCADIAEFETDRRFSVISFADVLEHMPYPSIGLAAAHELLVEGGLIFLSMPNMGSAVWEWLDAQNANPYWGEIEHYHNFSRARLEDFLRENGFATLSYGVSERYRASMEIIARAA